MTKRVVLFSMISALLLAGCGKSTPAEVARPVPLGNTKAQPVAPTVDEAQAPVYEEYPSDGTLPAEWAATDEAEEADEEAAASTEEEIAEAEAAEEARKAAEEAARLAKEAEEAEREAAEKAEREAEAKLKKPHTFAKSFGNGSLHTAQGLLIDDGTLFVVDNQRTGLLGKFAAVRVYDIETGDFLKRSIENIGWVGAKNMPTSVDRIQFEDGRLLAADSTTTYVFSLTDDKLVEKREGSFDLPTKVTNPKNKDVYRIAGNKIERVHDGDVKVSFGEDQITTATSIAVDADGTLYVSDIKGLVHVYNQPE